MWYVAVDQLDFMVHQLHILHIGHLKCRHHVDESYMLLN